MKTLPSWFVRPTPAILPPGRRRPWIRLSLGTMMGLVLLIGIGMGWVVHRARAQRDAVVGIERAGGSVRYDSQRGPRSPTPARKLWAPKWLVDRLGIDFFDDVIACGMKGKPAGGALPHIGRLTRLEGLDLQDASFASADLVYLEGLKSLQQLNLSRSTLTDPGMVHLKGLTALRELILLETRIGDAGLSQIGAMVHLKHLHLGGTDAGDLAMVHLRRMPRLEYLSLIGTRVGDAGLAHLEDAKSLKTIYLDDSPTRATNVTDEGLNHLRGLSQLRFLTLGRKVTTGGVGRLRQALPNATIENSRGAK